MKKKLVTFLLSVVLMLSPQLVWAGTTDEVQDAVNDTLDKSQQEANEANDFLQALVNHDVDTIQGMLTHNWDALSKKLCEEGVETECEGYELPVSAPDLDLFEESKLFTFSQDIYQMNPDGSERETLVPEGFFPTVSDDGNTLVYSRSDGNDHEIVVRDLETNEEKQVTHNNVDEHVPDISPDGSKITFVRNNGYYYQDIYVMDVDGSNVQRLTSGGYRDTETYPRWSPDGSKIAYQGEDGGYYQSNSEIYIMNADGSGKQKVTNNQNYDYTPSWSKDGSTLVFSVNGRQIATIHSDGTGYKNVTDYGKFQYAVLPKFSEDGKTIIFTGTTNYTLWAIGTDGSGTKRITDDRQFLGDWVW